MPDTPRSSAEFIMSDAATREQCVAILSRIVSGLKTRLPRINQVILPLVASSICPTHLPEHGLEGFTSIGDSDMKIPMKPTKIPGRVAIRHEGHMINAYWARPDTMEGAFWLGSIPAYFTEHKDIFERFKKLMIDGAGFVIEDITGGKIEKWMEQPAPEHEKSKE